MLVYLCAGAAALFYSLMVPVRVGLAWRNGSAVRAGISVGPVRLMLRGQARYQPGKGLIFTFTHASAGKQRELQLFSGGRKKPSPEFKRALRKARSYLVSRLHPERLRAHVVIALNDAAHTALAYGAARMLMMFLRARWPQWRMDLRAGADFRAQGIQADLLGILSCRTGHIMAAALLFCRDYLLGRLHTWTDNRSKAS